MPELLCFVYLHFCWRMWKKGQTGEHALPTVDTQAKVKWELLFIMPMLLTGKKLGV